LRLADGPRQTGRCVIYRSILFLLCVGLLASVTLVSADAAPAATKQTMRGEAVYYADRYRGRTMACGGRYYPNRMVAAHRTLPCGTRLRVRSRVTGRQVVVKVLDRGPFGDGGTILDLSRRAARRLGYIAAGRAPVRATILN
jgi:rare lipoprotein A